MHCRHSEQVFTFLCIPSQQHFPAGFLNLLSPTLFIFILTQIQVLCTQYSTVYCSIQILRRIPFIGDDISEKFPKFSEALEPGGAGSDFQSASY
jgi:hypothetical protein